MTNTYGYVRVSSTEQNEDRQLIALSSCDIPQKNIYMDKQSGKNFNRPQYKKLTRKLKKRRSALYYEQRPFRTEL